jgi:hypothetical protein
MLQFGDKSFAYSWWAGEKLKSSIESPLAFDTETELIRPYRQPVGEEKTLDLPLDPLHIPKPALGMAFDGKSLVLIHPSQFNKFFSVHRASHVVGHNLQFDWWVTFKHTDKVTREFLWALGDKNRLCDTMVLDMLLQLGTGNYRFMASNKEDAKIYPTNLGVLAKEWEIGDVNKSDEYRLRFGELLGLTQEEINKHPEADNFFSYALKDVIVTYLVYQKQRQAALAIMKRAGWSPTPKKTYEIRPDAVKEFGVLSEYLQVKASIVLAELSRTPIQINQQRRRETEKLARERYYTRLNKLLEVNPKLIKYYEKGENVGQPKLTHTTGLPQFNQKELLEVLTAEAKRLNLRLPKSDGKKGGISLSTKIWGRISNQSPFILEWVESEKDAKLLEFLSNIDAEEVYSKYSLLKLNGRTGASAHKEGKNILLIPSINIQQMPREDPTHEERSIRSLFRSKAKWGSYDYSYAELRTLASVCRARFGYSKLGDAIDEHTLKGGIDPHQRTAASILGITVEEFIRLPKDEQKKARQNAKPVNFGYPGGLGTKKFIDFSKTSYNVNFTPKEAKAAKKKWLELYDELKLYLDDPTQKAMEWQTGKKYGKLGWIEKKRLSDFLRVGEKERAKFSEDEADWIWEKLYNLAKAKGDKLTLADVESREVTRSVRNLLTYRACTLTGRVRNNCKYTDGANCPFSGLAADGAKLALWRLMRNGIKVLAFIHDSFDCEVSADPRISKQQSKLIQKIMIESLYEVCDKKVPVAVDGVVADNWSKA